MMKMRVYQTIIFALYQFYGQDHVICESDYSYLVENAFIVLRDLILETHKLFCGEAS